MPARQFQHGLDLDLPKQFPQEEELFVPEEAWPQEYPVSYYILLWKFFSDQEFSDELLKCSDEAVSFFFMC